MSKMKAKNVQIQVDHEKLGAAVMPQLLELIAKKIPEKDVYEKAIAELNVLNVTLQQKNNEMARQLDTYHKSIDDSFQDHENRILKLEGKPPVEVVEMIPAVAAEAAPSEVPSEVPAEVPSEVPAE
jgi:hypothetical protein